MKTLAELDVVLKALLPPKKKKERPRLLSTAAVAALVGIKAETLARYVAAGRVPGPTGRKAVLPAWTEDDVVKLRAAMATLEPLTAGTWWRTCRAEGYYSMAAAAKALGWPEVTFRARMVRGAFPRPAVQVGLHFFYTKEDVEKIGARFPPKETVRRLSATNP